MSEWKAINELGSIFTIVNDKTKQLKTTAYLSTGKYPIVDQSEKFICGYSDIDCAVIKDKIPIVVFGDHTRYVKYIDFPFIVGADGTQLLKPIASVDTLFFFHLVYKAAKEIGNYGYDRHLKHLRKYQTKIPTSLSEQRKIARILSTVDAVIEKTEAAIAKYKAIKTGMMHDLFTRGIDLKTGKLRPRYKDAPDLYKESELGWVPREWGVVALGNQDYFELATGGTPNTSISSYWNGSILWMSSGEVNKKRIVEVDGRITEEGYEHSNARFYPPNTVVIGLAGQGKTRGTVAITYIETTSNQSIAGIICSNKYSPFLLYHLLDYHYEDLRSVSAGSGRAGLSLTILSRFKLILPQTTEQALIAARLEAIDMNISSETIELNKYQQLKAALMSDLLTGKVRVKYEEEKAEAM